MENKSMDSSENETGDEISLIDLVSVLLKRKVMIITITMLAMIGAIIFSIVTIRLPSEQSPLPNVYTPAAHMLINDSSSGSSLSSLINSSGLGSLASIAGISGKSGSSYSSLAVYIAASNSFFDAITQKFDLIDRYKIKDFPRSTSRMMLKRKLTAAYDDKTGIFTISFTDTNPEFARDVVNFAVDYMEQRFVDMGLDKNRLEKKNLEENLETSYNTIVSLQKRISGIETSVSDVSGARSVPSIMLSSSMLKLELEAQQSVYKQLKTQLELTKIQMASETPVFQVIERAEVPDRKSGPSRGKLCIIVTFAAFFLSVFAAFALNAVEGIKNDPEAMKKLGRKTPETSHEA